MDGQTLQWEVASAWTPMRDDNAVDLWRVHLDALDASTAATLDATLSPDEVVRAARYGRPLDRERFRRARGVLRALLGRSLDCAPDAIVLGTNAHGKPLLASSSLCFNVAHSDDLALYALAWRRQVGVDVERTYEGDWRSVAAHFFSARERQALSTLDGPALTEAFFAIWTRKEAYLKARGLGLSLPLDSFDVDHQTGSQLVEVTTRDLAAGAGVPLPPETTNALHPSESVDVSPVPRPSRSGGKDHAANTPLSAPDAISPRSGEDTLFVQGQEARGRWTISDLVVEPGYAAALGVEGDDAWRLRCWNWGLDAALV